MASCGMLYLDQENPNWKLPVLIGLARAGVTASFALVYLTHQKYFPTCFSVTSMGIANFLCRIAVVFAPLVAEISFPTPTLYFATLQLMASISSLFIIEDEVEEPVKSKPLGKPPVPQLEQAVILEEDSELLTSPKPIFTPRAEEKISERPAEQLPNIEVEVVEEEKKLEEDEQPMSSRRELFEKLLNDRTSPTMSAGPPSGRDRRRSVQPGNFMNVEPIVPSPSNRQRGMSVGMMNFWRRRGTGYHAL